MTSLKTLVITVIEGAALFTWEDKVKGIKQERTFTQVEGERLIREVDNAILLIDQLRSHLGVEEREEREADIAAAVQAHFAAMVTVTIQDETPTETDDETPPDNETPAQDGDEPPDEEPPKQPERGRSQSRGKGKQQ